MDTQEIQKMQLDSAHFDRVRGGIKVTTVREGRRDVALGLMLLEETNARRGDNQGRLNLVDVYSVEYTTFEQIGDSVLVSEGVKTVSSLYRLMKTYYRDMELHSEITVVRFALK